MIVKEECGNDYMAVQQVVDTCSSESYQLQEAGMLKALKG
jgi:hypothetical protein